MDADFRTVRHAWIPMSDGTRLSARMWLPWDADESPVPAVLEYIPYRKGDWYARADSMVHPYFAQHGYGAVRVDVRGSGDSEGILLDEYLPQEQQDAYEVIGWLSEQAWCSGRVGMMGLSWGGFATLQVAALRPPALRAIIPCGFTDNRYTDDAHYIGGTVLASEMFFWSSTLFSYLALPPDPEVIGEPWERLWRERLEAVVPPVDRWLAHQRYDEYWRHGSVCEDYTAIICPVYAIGGLADGYTNALPRLLEGLEAPKKGLIGPWDHCFPLANEPGPQFGFLQECLRWWDHWLKDRDTGIMDEPMLRIWMPEPVARGGTGAAFPGRWVAESAWPSPNIEPMTMFLGDGTLGEDAEAQQTELAIVGDQSAGLESGPWCPLGYLFDQPPDQRREDGLALSFTSRPLSAGVEVVGYPKAVLTISSDRPLALVAVRLCEVTVDGTSSIVSRGILNLTHRESHSEPTALVPGESYRVTVLLKMTARSLPSGHRFRLTVSPTYWPWTWPSPEPVRLTVTTGERSFLELPIRRTNPKDDAQLRPFEEAAFVTPIASEIVSTSPSEWSIRHDVSSGRHDLDLRIAAVAGDSASGRVRLLDSNVEIEELHHDSYSILEGDPLSARVDCRRSCQLERGDWSAHVEVRTSATADRDAFRLTHLLEASSGSVIVFARTWDETIPRDLL